MIAEERAYCPICGDELVGLDLEISGLLIVCRCCNRKYEEDEIVWGKTKPIAASLWKAGGE